MSQVLEFPKPPRSWKVGVKTLNDRDWVYNSMRFPTKESAERYAKNLMARWLAVTDTHIEPTDEEPNQ